jgi:hypothetical protein
MTSLEDKDKRIRALESLISAHLPALVHVSALTTETIVLVAQAAEASPGPFSRPRSEERERERELSDSTTPATIASLGSTSAGPQPPTALHLPRSASFSEDPAMAPLSAAAIAKVEDHLLALDLSRKLSCQPSVVSFMSTHLGAIPDDPGEDDGRSTISASWPPYELAVQLVHVYLETNSLYPIYSREELVQE